jgi:hypothetical protein
VAAAELAAVVAAPAGDSGIATRAIAARDRARELGGLDREVADMLRHVVATHGDAIAGSELDPARMRAARDKLIARAEELLPKASPTASVAASPAELAAQLKDAMRANAFGDLRFSGRDPIEVIHELRAQWNELAVLVENDGDRASAARFAEVCERVLERVGGQQDERPHGEAKDRGRRRRRDQRSADLPQLATPTPSSGVEPGSPPPAVVQAAHDAVTAPAVVQAAAHDAVTAPAAQPFVARPAPLVLPAPPILPAAPSTPDGSASRRSDPPRAKSASTLPPLDELDSAWDMPDEDPTATKDETPPSASEMAGDSATGGDGIDEPGWD